MKKLITGSLALLLITCPSFSTELITKKTFSLGMNSTSGNTRTLSLHTDFLLSQNRRWNDEFTAKGYFDQQKSGGVDTMLKFGLDLRYGKSLDRQKYIFANMEVEQERFKGIDLSLTPTIGFGWWLSSEGPVKQLAEASFGYETENLASQRAASSVVELRHNIAADLDGKSALENDLHIYLSAADPNNYRIVNAFSFRVPFQEDFKLKLTLKDDYFNAPPVGTLNNDLQFVTSIEYSFEGREEI